MGNTYVVSDTHFTSLRGYNPTTRQQYINQVADVWNAVVNPQDTVIHLGDVVWSRHGLGYLEHLHGKKILVLGNHDTLEHRMYAQHFYAIYPYYHIHDILFSHAPLCPHWKTKHQVGHTVMDISHILTDGRFRLSAHKNIPIKTIKHNIHGHFHQIGKTKFEKKSAYYHQQTPYTMLCVDSTPTLLEEIINTL